MNIEKKSLLLASMTMGVLSIGVEALAQPENQTVSPINLEAITCRELLLMDGEEEENTILFMHGYMSGKREETMIDIGQLVAVTDQVKNTCIDQPSQEVIQVFEQYR
ncbi:MAG: HdeA family protein [Halothece sp. Uz-M2-17]|nr:HdeA family protein [Halothece sp. Uz-M2-17]